MWQGVVGFLVLNTKFIRLNCLCGGGCKRLVGGSAILWFSGVCISHRMCLVVWFNFLFSDIINCWCASVA